MKFLSLGYSIFWALGLKYLYLFAIFLLFSKRLVSDLKLAVKRQPFIISFLFLFLAYQILSTVIGVFSAEIDILRLIGIFHNYFVYFIFVLFAASASVRIYTLPVYTLIIAAFLLLTYFYALTFNVELVWQGVLEKVALVEKGYLNEGSVSRLSAFTPYFNATTILVIGAFYITYREFIGIKYKLGVVVYFLYLFLIVSTGSRLGVLLFAGLAPFVLLKDFRFALILYLLAFIFIIIFGADIYHYISSLREDSSGTRKFIYEFSIAYTMNENMITGLGYKPKPEWLKYPIGSHSTFIGYFVKNGLIGFLLWLSIVLIIVGCSIRVVVVNAKSNIKPYAFDLLVLLILILFFLFEDMDAFELNAIIFGIVFGNVLAGLNECKYRGVSEVGRSIQRGGLIY